MRTSLRPHVPVSPAASRIVALDLLRGYFILIIASIHLSYYPSLMGVFDGRGILYVSEADGFFFISGLLIGIIRQRDLVKNGFKSAAIHLFKRGWVLYRAGVILSLTYLLIALITTSAGINGAKTGIVTDSPLKVIFETLTLQYSYGWTDFLMYYAAFMFIAPLIIWLLSKGKWWLVLGLSYFFFYLHWRNDIPSQFLQWQAPFFIGTVIGYHWDDIIARYRSFSTSWRTLIRRSSIFSTLAIYILGLLFVYIPSVINNPPQALKSVYDNPLHDALLLDFRSGILRPLLLVITMSGLLFMVRKYEDLILRTIGAFILPFGQNSLYVYIIESVILFAIPYIVSPQSFLLNTVIEVIMIFLVWIALRKRFLFRIIPR